MRLKDAPEALTWFGRGPHENYPDRKLSANVGRWRVPTGEMHTPYIFPSDNGLRCDVNELEVGLVRVSGDFHFAASQYGMEQLRSAQHDYELQKESGLYLCIDGFHMGVGGDDSWTRSVKPEYRLVEGEYKWCFCLS
jgi:beta-galactosidase